jgi:Flp pilus assembly pilin Flp
MASSPRSSGVVIIGAITAVGTQLITTFSAVSTAL